MPVYNTGEILRNTIDSIIRQTYTQWSLFLVDDGSIDQSGRICDEYAQKDHRIKVFHKENGGICDARNYGLSRVNTKYVTFCDHDDEYKPDLLAIAIPYLQEIQDGYVAFRYETIYDDGHVIPSGFGGYEHQMKHVNIKSDFVQLYDQNMFHTVWSKIYVTSSIRNENIIFDTKFKRGGEDIDFNLRLLKKEGKYIYIPHILYTHYVRASLSTSGKLHPENIFLFEQQMEQFNTSINNLDIDISENKTKYLSVYAKYLHLFVSYLPYLKVPYSNKIEMIRNYGKYYFCDELPTSIEIGSIPNRISKTCLYLYNRNLFKVLYAIFLVKKHFK